MRSDVSQQRRLGLAGHHCGPDLHFAEVRYRPTSGCQRLEAPHDQRDRDRLFAEKWPGRAGSRTARRFEVLERPICLARQADRTDRPKLRRAAALVWDWIRSEALEYETL